MSFDFISLASPGIRGLQPYQPGKPVEELERELGLTNVIKLASNENPLGPSPKVIEALSRAATELARYPDGSAFHLKRLLADHLDVATNTLTIGNGSNDVLELLARVFLRPGTESIVSQHSFVVYPLVTTALGADLTVIPAKNFCQDLDATLAAISARTRMIFIANPNNPTGSWIDEQSITQFLDQVPHNVIVVLDEAYFEYVDEPTYPDGIRLFSKYPNLVVTRTFSKAYGLAALRLGYAVSHPDIADMMNRVRQPFNVNSLALAGAEAALADQAHVQEAIALNKAGMAYFEQACEQLGLGYIPSAGNFIAVDFGKPAGPIYEALLKEGIIVRPVGVYEMPHHLRITIGLKHENERCVESIKKVLFAS